MQRLFDPATERYLLERLRWLLELSTTCDMEQVCDDSAREIERLRDKRGEPLRLPVDTRIRDA